MAKTGGKKKVASAARKLPPGIKPFTGPIDPVLRKMIHEDRAIASGGRNIVHRKTGAAVRWAANPNDQEAEEPLVNNAPRSEMVSICIDNVSIGQHNYIP